MELKNIDRAEAFRYMGHRGGEIPARLVSIAEECERLLLSAAQPRFVYAVFDTERTADGTALKNASLILRGNDVSAHLGSCEKCVLLAATLGAGADKVIRSLEAVEMEKAVVADSLASAAVEQVCDKAEEEIRGRLSGYNFTWRFSPGYGDLPLDTQRGLLEVLGAGKRIGLSVTDSMIMLPRKSVTAVIGISENEIPKGRRGCAACAIKDKCAFRKAGEHCG